MTGFARTDKCNNCNVLSAICHEKNPLPLLEVRLPEELSHSEALRSADRSARVDLDIVSYGALVCLIMCLVLLCVPNAFLV